MQLAPIDFLISSNNPLRRTQKIVCDLKNIKEDFLQRKKQTPADMVDWNQIHEQY